MNETKFLKMLHSDSAIPRIRASIPASHAAQALLASGSERILSAARESAATAMEALAQLPLDSIETEVDCSRIAAAMVPTDGVSSDVKPWREYGQTLVEAVLLTGLALRDNATAKGTNQ